MAFTKQVARHDSITIDNTDYSNAFRRFGLTSDAAAVDVPGFSVKGNNEQLAGGVTQSFTGDMYFTAETSAAMWEIHQSKDIVMVEWQPDGLVDATREVFQGNCQLLNFPAEDTWGEATVMTLTFTAADENGIYMTGT